MFDHFHLPTIFSNLTHHLPELSQVGDKDASCIFDSIPVRPKHGDRCAPRCWVATAQIRWSRVETEERRNGGTVLETWMGQKTPRGLYVSLSFWWHGFFFLQIPKRAKNRYKFKMISKISQNSENSIGFPHVFPKISVHSIIHQVRITGLTILPPPGQIVGLPQCLHVWMTWCLEAVWRIFFCCLNHVSCCEDRHVCDWVMRMPRRKTWLSSEDIGDQKTGVAFVSARWCVSHVTNVPRVDLFLLGDQFVSQESAADFTHCWARCGTLHVRDPGRGSVSTLGGPQNNGFWRRKTMKNHRNP